MYKLKSHKILKSVQMSRILLFAEVADQIRRHLFYPNMVSESRQEKEINGESMAH